MLGGGDADEVWGFRELPSFSLHEKRWYSSQTTPAGKEKEEEVKETEEKEEAEEEDETKECFPVARYFHSAVQIDAAVWVFGGTDREGRSLDDVWRRNLAGDFTSTGYSALGRPRVC